MPDAGLLVGRGYGLETQRRIEAFEIGLGRYVHAAPRPSCGDLPQRLPHHAAAEPFPALPANDEHASHGGLLMKDVRRDDPEKGDDASLLLDPLEERAGIDCVRIGAGDPLFEEENLLAGLYDTVVGFRRQLAERGGVDGQGL